MNKIVGVGLVKDSNKITIFAKDNSIIDSKHLEKDLGLDFSLPCDVYFYSLALRGGKEDMNKPRYFYGENGEVILVMSVII